MTLTDPNPVDTTAEVQQRRHRPALAWALGSTAAVVIGGWVVLGSPLLAVETIDVVGYQGDSQVVTQAAGVTAGSSLLLLNPAKVSERVTSLEDVASATVARQWPDTVVITVTPDQPVAFLKAPDGFHILGGSGGQVSVVAQQPSDLAQLGPMSEIQSTDALALLGSLPSDTRAQVERVEFDEQSGYTLILRDSQGTVVWGQSQEALLKSTVLSAMMRVDDTARWFDVTNPRAPRAGAEPPQRSEGEAPTGGSEAPAVGSETPTQSDDSGTGAVEPQGTGGEQSVGLRPTG